MLILKSLNAHPKVCWAQTRAADAGQVLCPGMSSFPPAHELFFRPAGKQSALFPLPPPATPQFSHFRGPQSEESLLKRRLLGFTTGISDSRLWAGPQDLYFRHISSGCWWWCRWFHDYTLRITAPGKIDLSSGLPELFSCFILISTKQIMSVSSQESVSSLREGADFAGLGEGW